MPVRRVAEQLLDHLEVSAGRNRCARGTLAKRGQPNASQPGTAGDAGKCPERVPRVYGRANPQYLQL